MQRFTKRGNGNSRSAKTPELPKASVISGYFNLAKRDRSAPGNKIKRGYARRTGKPCTAGDSSHTSGQPSTRRKYQICQHSKSRSCVEHRSERSSATGPRAARPSSRKFRARRKRPERPGNSTEGNSVQPIMNSENTRRPPRERRPAPKMRKCATGSSKWRHT